MTNPTFSHRPQAIFLMGPTASGKTALAIMLRQHLPVEIISVDSALVYRGMDIGTAKPSKEELAQVPHRLINIRNPADSYSVADFLRDALKEMADITEAGRIPLLVGGTMFYFKALLEGLPPLPASDTKVRTYIQNEAEKVGWKALHQKLQHIDPIAAIRIHPHDLQRLSRALEVFFISGSTLTELTKISGEPLAYHVHQFAIAPLDRVSLHQRIVRRFHKMLAAGFEHEVNVLFAKYNFYRNIPFLRYVGYRQMWSYITGKTNYDDMVLHGICATQQLAKRQMTWLRGWRNIYWLDSNEPTTAFEKILQVVSSYIG